MQKRDDEAISGHDFVIVYMGPKSDPVMGISITEMITTPFQRREVVIVQMRPKSDPVMEISIAKEVTIPSRV